MLSVPENQDFENDLNQNVNENNNELEIHNDDSTPISVISPSAFMEEKLKTLKTVKSEKKSTVRNTVGKIVSGKPITVSDVQKKLVDHQCTQTKSATKSTVTKRKIKSNKGKGKGNVCKKKKSEYAGDILSSQQPGPSGLHLPSSFDSSDDETV